MLPGFCCLLQGQIYSVSPGKNYTVVPVSKVPDSGANQPHAVEMNGTGLAFGSGVFPETSLRSHAMNIPCRFILLTCALLASLVAGCNDRPQPGGNRATTTAMSPPVGHPDPSMPAETPTPPANPAETSDHAKADPNPHREMTKQEEASGMPMPGQNNDESSLALDPKK
jgi:hypothetical protein